MPQNSIDKEKLIIVYTGDGKGKTTSAMGLMLRTLGHNGKVFVIQFLKSSNLKTGEKKMAEMLKVSWENYGTGFLKSENDFKEAKEIIQKGWAKAKEVISSNSYDLVILDELTYCLTNDLIKLEEVVNFLKKNKSAHIVITGRNAPKALIDIADLVSEVNLVKHPYIDRNLKAQKMIEF